mgnify:CR=1 FL=1
MSYCPKSEHGLSNFNILDMQAISLHYTVTVGKITQKIFLPPKIFFGHRTFTLFIRYATMAEWNNNGVGLTIFTHLEKG